VNAKSASLEATKRFIKTLKEDTNDFNATRELLRKDEHFFNDVSLSEIASQLSRCFARRGSSWHYNEGLASLMHRVLELANENPGQFQARELSNIMLMSRELVKMSFYLKDSNRDKGIAALEKVLADYKKLLNVWGHLLDSSELNFKDLCFAVGSMLANKRSYAQLAGGSVWDPNLAKKVLSKSCQKLSEKLAETDSLTRENLLDVLNLSRVMFVYMFISEDLLTEINNVFFKKDQNGLSRADKASGLSKHQLLAYKCEALLFTSTCGIRNSDQLDKVGYDLVVELPNADYKDIEAQSIAAYLLSLYEHNQEVPPKLLRKLEERLTAEVETGRSLVGNFNWASYYAVQYLMLKLDEPAPRTIALAERLSKEATEGSSALEGEVGAKLKAALKDHQGDLLVHQRYPPIVCDFIYKPSDPSLRSVNIEADGFFYHCAFDVDSGTFRNDRQLKDRLRDEYMLKVHGIPVVRVGISSWSPETGIQIDGIIPLIQRAQQQPEPNSPD
jgi:hypothetical protein